MSDVSYKPQCHAWAVRTMLAGRLSCGAVVRFREQELSIAATVYQGCGIEADSIFRARSCRPQSNGILTDRRNANHCSRHRQEDLHGCARRPCLISKSPAIHVLNGAAKVACSIGVKHSPDAAP